MPASHLQPMTEVAKPVIWVAAIMAQRRLRAVMMTRVPHILKASAKVSSISTPLISIRGHSLQPPIQGTVTALGQIVLDLHRVVLEFQAVILLKVILDGGLDLVVVAGHHIQAAARLIAHDAAILRHQLARP